MNQYYACPVRMSDRIESQEYKEEAGCNICKNGDEVWGRYVCGKAMKYPSCKDRGGFERIGDGTKLRSTN